MSRPLLRVCLSLVVCCMIGSAKTLPETTASGDVAQPSAATVLPQLPDSQAKRPIFFVHSNTNVTLDSEARDHNSLNYSKAKVIHGLEVMDPSSLIQSYTNAVQDSEFMGPTTVIHSYTSATQDAEANDSTTIFSFVKNITEDQHNSPQHHISLTTRASPPAKEPPSISPAPPHSAAPSHITIPTPHHPGCPLPYIRVGQRCVYIPTKAKLNWYVARRFCQAASGDLLTFRDIQDYLDLIEYLQRLDPPKPEVDISSPDDWLDVWVGGRLVDGGRHTGNPIMKNPGVWMWVNNATMPLGSPYWSPISNNSRFWIYRNICPSEHTSQSRQLQSSDCRCAYLSNRYYYFLDMELGRLEKSFACVLDEDVTIFLPQLSPDLS